MRMSMELQLNLELRSQILEYSLFLESSINDLVLLSLGIYNDKEKTKLFNNQGRLTFQNKVDLLLDIDVLTPEESLEFGLLMFIRNKFLHDLECNSFKILFSEKTKDAGIHSRFKNFLKEGQSIFDEDACKQACYNIFVKNIDTIRNKVIEKQEAIEIKYKLFQVQNERIIHYIDFIHDFSHRISSIVKNSELEDPKVAIVGMEIFKVLDKYSQELKNTSENSIYDDFFKSDENLKAIFDIKGELKDLPKWDDFNLENKHKLNN